MCSGHCLTPQWHPRWRHHPDGDMTGAAQTRTWNNSSLFSPSHAFRMLPDAVGESPAATVQVLNHSACSYLVQQLARLAVVRIQGVAGCRGRVPSGESGDIAAGLAHKPHRRIAACNPKPDSDTRLDSCNQTCTCRCRCRLVVASSRPRGCRPALFWQEKLREHKVLSCAVHNTCRCSYFSGDHCLHRSIERPCLIWG